MSISFSNIQTWEEFASSAPKNAADTDKLMAAIYYHFEMENTDTVEIKTITGNYFRRARWSRPVNLSATPIIAPVGVGFLKSEGEKLKNFGKLQNVDMKLSQLKCLNSRRTK